MGWVPGAKPNQQGPGTTPRVLYEQCTRVCGCTHAPALNTIPWWATVVSPMGPGNRPATHREDGCKASPSPPHTHPPRPQSLHTTAPHHTWPPTPVQPLAPPAAPAAPPYRTHPPTHLHRYNSQRHGAPPASGLQRRHGGQVWRREGGNGAKQSCLAVLVAEFSPRTAPSMVAGQGRAPSRGFGAVTRPRALLSRGSLGMVAGVNGHTPLSPQIL